MEAADEFRLGFNDVKGWAVEFRGNRNQVDDEGDKTETNDIPVPDAQMSCVDNDPVTSTTVTTVIPRAAS